MSDSSFKKAVGGKLKLKGVEFKGKKTIVKKDKQDEAAEENVHRVSNQKPQQMQQVLGFLLLELVANIHVQHYRVVQTPDGNQTVAIKSTSRESDLNHRVKTKSDRFCMHT
mmetsp:Transcript_42186/g.112834  ORF Transcript_42186/g.112834 Transcript_42186/m.112834 type:complete len:111 (-) Transcript_42186:283-615(-)